MRGHLALSFLLGLPGLMACSDGDKGGDTGGHNHGGTDFAPAEGTWEVTSEDVIVDSCGYTDGGEGSNSDPDISFSLSDEGDGAWLIVTDDDDATTMNCTLDDHALTCDPLTESQDLAPKGLAAVIDISQGLSADFGTEMSGTYVMTLDAECAGKDCEALAGMGMVFPCAVELNGEIAHSM